MPEILLALIVVLFLSTLVFAFAAKPCSKIMDIRDFRRRRNTWYAVTLIAFLAHNYWLFAFAAGLFIYYFNKRETNPAALFLLLLFAVPPRGLAIPGFGLINILFELTYIRLLILVTLLPAFLNLVSRKNTVSFGRLPADKFVAGYLILIVILFLRETTVTDTLRQAFYQFIDVLVPYYVISRSIKNKETIREMILCFTLAALLLAPIAIFEMIKYWQLYDPVSVALDTKGRHAGYATRISFLRASGSVGPIPLGYLMVVAIGFYLYLQNQISSTLLRRTGMYSLIGGLIAALSRAPWVGSLLLLFVYILSGKRKASDIAKVVIGAIIVLPLLSTVLDLQEFYDILPWVGTEEAQRNVDYREQVVQNSMIVIKRNPWFGSVDYLETPEMEALRTGQGIIDIVNTYIRVGLETGFVGLSLFVGFFLTVCWGLFKSFTRVRKRDEDLHLLGRCLLATMLSILFIIYTVSSVSIIPIVYWSVAAIGVGYSNLVEQELRRLKIEDEQAAPVTTVT